MRAFRGEIVGGRRDSVKAFLVADRDAILSALGVELGYVVKKSLANEDAHLRGLLGLALDHNHADIARDFLLLMGDLSTALSPAGLSVILQAVISDWHWELFDPLFLDSQPVPGRESRGPYAGTRAHPDFWAKLEWYIFSALYPGYYALTTGEDFQTRATLELLKRQDTYNLRGDPNWKALCSRVFLSLAQASNRDMAVLLLVEGGLPVALEDLDLRSLGSMSARTRNIVMRAWSGVNGALEEVPLALIHPTA
ncbi:hypothetical protein M427DRAFT_57060 [Gonapodya prolifera JEL478]|uniref:Uncharacterized protein n=1 Tax=Gonapodya prolifera (strain JEL478) TaxID=1344416 RepID=A0A139ADM1_GONPJ|nr:hypothetical protein M427DRAFT_57060 [Gonapodya prolifera JEL478]|eukprot:KXS14912.1 hypothetical protein M427DRAFT_57060 [Gonapodya prolifera JEL478]